MTPDGDYLGAKFVGTRKRDIIRLMRKALEKWKQIVREKGLQPQPIPVKAANNSWGERQKNAALFLQVNYRDLPRGSEQNPGTRWHQWAWNQNWVEFSKGEALGFIPKSGRMAKVPEGTVRKMARKYLIDLVRGEEPGWNSREIKKAWMSSEIIAANGGFITVRLTGQVRAERGAPGQFMQYTGHTRIQAGWMGYDAKLHGRAIFNTRTQKFILFELVAAGLRWGGGKYNARRTDVEPAPLGVSFILEDQYDRKLPAACCAVPKKRTARLFSALAAYKKKQQAAKKEVAEKKTASAEAVAVRDRALRKRVIEAVQAGQRPRFFCRAYRSRASVISLDDKGALVIECKTVELPTIWARLTIRDRLSLSLALLREGVQADHCLVGFYYLATGDATKAGPHLAKAGTCASAARAAFQ